VTFFPKQHVIWGDWYASLLVARYMGLDNLKFSTSAPENIIKDAKKNLVPFPGPIMLCRNITFYNIVT